MKFILLILSLILSGCFGGVPSYKVRKEALTPKYHLYLEDAEEREKIDAEWLRSNKDLGFGFLPHPISLIFLRLVPEEYWAQMILSLKKSGMMLTF